MMSLKDVAQALREAADIIENQQKIIDGMVDLPNCNCCGNDSCGIRPKLGTPVRLNCHLYSHHLRGNKK